MVKFATKLILCLGIVLTSCARESELSPGKSGSITRFAVYQHFMYVLNANEVQTYDIANAEKPVLIHELPTDYGLETIIIYNNTIFLGSTTSLYILNISDPAAPFIESQTVRDVIFGRCDPVVVKDSFAYSTVKVIENRCGILSEESNLLVYSIADKANPELKSIYPMDIPNGLGYYGNYLFVCDEGADKVVVFDISNPLDVKTTPYDFQLTDPVDLIVDGTRLIISTKTNFAIYNAEDITNIRSEAFIPK